jgi:hypothetical protein
MPIFKYAFSIFSFVKHSIDAACTPIALCFQRKFAKDHYNFFNGTFTLLLYLPLDHTVLFFPVIRSAQAPVIFEWIAQQFYIVAFFL